MASTGTSTLEDLPWDIGFLDTAEEPQVQWERVLGTAFCSSWSGTMFVSRARFHSAYQLSMIVDGGIGGQCGVRWN